MFNKKWFLLIVLVLIMLNIFGWGIYFSYLLLPYCFNYIIQKKGKYDLGFISIALFSVFYTIMVSVNVNMFYPAASIFVGYLFLPPAFYIAGQILIDKLERSNQLYRILLLSAFFLSLIPFISNVNDVINYGFMKRLNVTLPWNAEENITSATLIAGYLSLNISIIPILFISGLNWDEKRYKIYSLFLILMGLFSIINMARRTSLVIIIITLTLFTLLVKNKKATWFYLVVFFTILIYVYSVNKWNVRTFFEDSIFFKRITGAIDVRGDTRINIWSAAINHIWKNPFGNYEVFSTKIGYAHNLWLDVAGKAGIIPVLFLLLHTFYNIFNSAKVILNKAYPDLLRFILLGFSTAFLVTFFVEPVMEGLFNLFCVFCLFSGMIKQIRGSNKFDVNTVPIG